MAVVSVAVPYADTWYFDTALSGLRAMAAAHGHELDVWAETPGPAARRNVAARIGQHLSDPGCVGAIAMHFLLKGDLIELVTASGKPVVLVGGRSADLPVVRLDDVRIARRAVQHLIDLGHRDIAHLGGSVAAPDDFTIRADRVRGYSEAMAEAGLENQATVRTCAFQLEEAKAAALGLIAGADRPSAVFAVVDDVAIGVLAAARELGLSVPRDLSVIGIDDRSESAALQLTTIRQDPAAVGRAAAARLLGLTDDDDQVMPFELVVRGTTAPPREAARGLLRRLLRGR